MKKLLLSLVAVAGLVYGAKAQTEKGNFMLGGNVGVNSTKVDGAPKADFSFSVLPSVGYFISNYYYRFQAGNKIFHLDIQFTI